MSSFNNNSYKFRRVHARRNATHGCMPRTTPCKEVLSSLLPPAFGNFQRQARIARDKGTILTSCLGQREPKPCKIQRCVVCCTVCCTRFHAALRTFARRCARIGNVETDMDRLGHKPVRFTWAARIYKRLETPLPSQCTVQCELWPHHLQACPACSRPSARLILSQAAT